MEHGEPVLVKLAPQPHELLATDLLKRITGVQISKERFDVIPTGVAGDITGALSGGTLATSADLAGSSREASPAITFPADAIELPVTRLISSPPTLRVEWSVTDAAALDAGDYMMLDNPAAPLEAAFLFAPPIRELKVDEDPDSPQHVTRQIRARIRLDSEGVQGRLAAGNTAARASAFYWHTDRAGIIQALRRGTCTSTPARQ